MIEPAEANALEAVFAETHRNMLKLAEQVAFLTDITQQMAERLYELEKHVVEIRKG